jgi:hypothetical protein
MIRFFLAACLFFLAGLLPAQTANNPSLDPKQLPAVVTENFTRQFPNVTPIWRKDGNNFKVSFVDPESKLGRVLVYDKKGNVVRSENEVDSTGYPTAIGDYYSDNYPGETFQVWSTDDKTGGKTLYFSNRNEETIWFDQQGKVVPSKKANNAVKADPNKK